MVKRPNDRSTVPPFSHSAIQPFNHSAIQLFSHSTMQPFSYAAIQLCSHAAVQPFSRSRRPLSTFGRVYSRLAIQNIWRRPPYYLYGRRPEIEVSRFLVFDRFTRTRVLCTRCYGDRTLKDSRIEACSRVRSFARSLAFLTVFLRSTRVRRIPRTHGELFERVDGRQHPNA